MHPSVKDRWIAFNEPLEGIVYNMYADVKNLITCGMGNLIDPKVGALSLPWQKPDGSLATYNEISAAWDAIKRDPFSASRGWKYAARLPGNALRLSRPAVETFIFDKLRDNDRSLAKRFPNWENIPSDAQLAIHSMCWAMGPNFFSGFPRFTSFIKAGDYKAAAEECTIHPEMGTIVKRNALNRELLRNA